MEDYFSRYVLIFFNHRYRYRLLILEAEIIGHRPSTFFFQTFGQAVFMLLSVLEPLSTQQNMEVCTQGDNPFFGSYKVTCAQACMFWFVDKQKGEMEV